MPARDFIDIPAARRQGKARRIFLDMSDATDENRLNGSAQFGL